MKIAIIFFVSVFGLWILFISIGSAGDYNFTWDANHSNDNVNRYRIYYRTTSGLYTATDCKEVSAKVSKLDGPYHAWGFTLPEVAEEYCFAATAVDTDDFESDPSNGVGRDTSCKEAVFDTNFRSGGVGCDIDDGGGGGGSGGGCFILQLMRAWEKFIK